MSYTLRKIITKPLPEYGKEWNPLDVRYTLYWVEGPGGVNRPATDIEVAIWMQAVERAIAVVKPYEKHVNVSDFGGTPEEALRKEFGV